MPSQRGAVSAGALPVRAGGAPRDRQAGGQKPSLRILRGLFAALDDPTGVLAPRLGTLERVAFLLADWRHTKLRLADTEARMTAVLEQL